MDGRCNGTLVSDYNYIPSTPATKIFDLSLDTEKGRRFCRPSFIYAYSLHYMLSKQIVHTPWTKIKTISDVIHFITFSSSSH